ncbi:MAG: hypothetical protein RR139_00400 [Lachnospiraceae bacterium]
MKQMKKYGLIFLAMNLVGVGVALFLENQLGSDSIALLCDGIYHVLPVSYGTASLLYNLLIILVALVVARKNIGVGTIAYALLSGYFIDFYCWVLHPLQMGQNHFAIRFLGYFLGQLCLSLALAILIQLSLGMNALDAVLHKVHEKTKLPYAVLRTGTDFTYSAVGTLLGGTFGVGTVISIASTGFLISCFSKAIQRLQKDKKGGS